MVDQLDESSQGLVRLDRYLGKLVSEAGKTHPIFAIRFASYVERCHNNRRSPKGRSMLAIVAQRFRLDRARGRAISVFHLFSIELEGYKRQQVQSFVNKVRYILVNVRTDELKDKELIYDWLWEKFKNYGAIAHEVRKIRQSSWKPLLDVALLMGSHQLTS